MNKKIKFGLIGYGGFGKFVCNAVSESKLVDIIAIADTNIPSGEIPDGVIFFSDWKKMLSSSAVEAVFVATPPSSHFEITRYAIESNKHVIVEKPLTITPDEAVIIRKLAEEFNRIVIVDFMLRFNPLLNKQYQLCLKNLTGPLERYYVENYAQDESLPAEHWFWDEKISGGIITEHAVHFIDLVHWFDDQPVLSINGNFDYRNNTQKDRVFATIHYQNGLIASHYHSFSRPQIFERTKMRFVFSNAQFDFDGWIPESGHFTLLGTHKTEYELATFPNLEITKKEAVTNKPIRGKPFDFTHLFEGRFSSSLTKQELYSNAVRDLFEDFSKKIYDDSHHLKVSLDDAIKAVHLAHEAKNNASISNFSPN